MLKDKPRGKWVVVMNVQFQEEIQVPNDHMKRRSSYLAIEMQTETMNYFYLPTAKSRNTVLSHMAARQLPEPFRRLGQQ